MWHLKTFNQLKNSELEQIFRLRQSIFIVEQKSYFDDIDGLDYNALHLFNTDNDVVWAYCRILEYDDKVKFGRITVKKERRGNGSGRKLLDKVIEVIYENYPNKDIHIMAMSYLQDFYESYGFKPVSEVYIIDQHPHLDMILYR